jgi:hypothetical protein
MNKGEETMKNPSTKTILFAAALISGFLFCLSCTKTDTALEASAAPATTIIQIQIPNADGLPGTQLTFNYEALFIPLIEFYGEAFPVKICSTASLNTFLDGSPRMIEDYTWLFATYANEDDPLIDKILREALQIGTAEKIGFGNDFSFSGYQKEDEYGDSGLSVDLQVLAIWSVFHKVLRSI